MAELPVLLSETSFSAAPTDSSSQQGASLSSTPPTTVADSISLASDGPKPELETEQAPLVEVHEEPVQPVIVAKEPLSEPDPPPSTGRARRARQAPVYNLSKLSGTDVHGKRAAKGDIVGDRRRRRTISGGGTLIGDDANDTSRRMASRAVQDGIEALDLEWSVGKLSTPRAARSPRKMTTKGTPPARRIGTRQSGVRADSLAEK
ncbi:MAG: hypothetical protein OK454_08290, partial [Thaumarchaeota archaeon]|nr:hypothetical protein [Nitrososphaerota archaeon]